MNKENDFRSTILSLDFIKAKQFLPQYSSKELYDELMEIGFENNNILSYIFVSYLISCNEDAEYHSLASDILALPLCHYNGSYQASLFHARRALELDPSNIEYKEWILFFYGIPDKLVSREEAIAIAKEILTDKPDSLIAKEVLA